jgi:hypothetical protein
MRCSTATSRMCEAMTVQTRDEMLAPLDRKWERPVTLDDWRALGTKSIDQFTDDDLLIVQAFDGPASAQAKRETRDRWLTLAPPSSPVVISEASAPVTAISDADEFADVIIQTIKGAIESPMVKGRIDGLEVRLAALEKKPFVKFLGTYEHGKAYEAGAAVVHRSALWICLAATTGEPSRDFIGWQLALKRGDAK